MTVETLIIKLGVNPKEVSKAEIILLTSLVERYNHGYMRRSIYFSYEEVLIKKQKVLYTDIYQKLTVLYMRIRYEMNNYI